MAATMVIDMVEDLIAVMVEDVDVDEAENKDANTPKENIVTHTDVAPMAATNVRHQGPITPLKPPSTTGWAAAPEVAFGSNDG